MKDIILDQTFYEKLWEVVINPEIANYASMPAEHDEKLQIIKDRIRDKFVLLYSHCKNNYVVNPEEMDRHKIAACYTAAVATVRPLDLLYNTDSEIKDSMANEKLAITVGLSALRAFTIAAIKESTKTNKIRAQYLINRFSDDMKIPKNLVNHGSYISNFAKELHLAVAEEKLNILSLAHEFYWIEIFTRGLKEYIVYKPCREERR